MIGIRYYKADSSTFVIKTVGGKIMKQGKGLSFFYNSATTSVAAIPGNIQEAPFIFNLQTADYQSIRIQGQVSYLIENAVMAASMLNFNLRTDGNYVSEDPLNLGDSLIRYIQSMLQAEVLETALRPVLQSGQKLVKLVKKELPQEASLLAMGIAIVDFTISNIAPTPETARALETEAREAILKEADDAVYDRRKSAVEQERTIREAELQTELSIQQKQQEIEASRLENERAILRSEIETERERLQAQIQSEEQRRTLVCSAAENSRTEAEAEAYAIDAKMRAFSSLPVENLKAIALSQMQPDQLMALAFESLAQNAGKIGELNISPDLFSQLNRQFNNTSKGSMA